jgi:hypothetical protein
VWNNVEEVVVFDDASQDATFELAVGLKTLCDLSKLRVLKHAKNLGYGGNQKAGYRYFVEIGRGSCRGLDPHQRQCGPSPKGRGDQVERHGDDQKAVESHGQAIKDICLYPLLTDARQRLCRDSTR